MTVHRSARFATVDTDYGAMYGGYRPAGPGMNYWRIGQFYFPFWTSPGPGVLGRKVANTCWVPMDDSHTMVFDVRAVADPTMGGGPTMQPSRGEFGDFRDYGFPFLANTTDWFGRYRMAQNWENDFLMDREEQRQLGSYTGMQGGAVPEDTAVQISMGSTLDRTIEHLGTSDLMIIRTRQQLLDAARLGTEHKVPPPGVDDLASGTALAPRGVFIPGSGLDRVHQGSRASIRRPPRDRSGYRGRRPDQDATQAGSSAK